MGAEESSVSIELNRIEEQKRRVYSIAFICAALIFMLSWFIRDPGDVFVERLYPVFSIIMLGIFLAIWRRTQPIGKIEIISLALLSGIILSRLAWHFYSVKPIGEQLLVLAGGHYWAVAILILGGFIVLDHQYGMVFGCIVILLSVIIAATGLAFQWSMDLPLRESLVYLIRIHLFLTIIMILSGIATTVRDKLKNALIRAEFLDKWANTDMLTNLANRRAAEQFVKEQIKLASGYEHRFWIIIADLDNFKKINDTHGHVVGDAVLAEVGGILGKIVRKSDIVARWGGEEFLIVLTNISGDDAKKFAERCREAIADRPLAGIRVTATLGVAGYNPGDTLRDVLDRADSLLYSGKSAGRNRVIIAV